MNKQTDDNELPPMKISDVLMRAVGLIETHGHTKHVYADEEGRYCVVGAVRAAISPRLLDHGIYNNVVTVDERNAYVASYGYLREAYGVSTSVGSVIDFNDRDTTTKDDIIALLKTAATCARVNEVGDGT